ncbi:MAG: hypothetical protein ABI828_02045, partial [Actinomycetota bacterium]
RFDVNPTIEAWVGVLLVNLFHMCIYAALAFRYLYFADAVPDAPARRPRGAAASKKSASARPGSSKAQVKAPASKKTSTKGTASKGAKNRRP